MSPRSSILLCIVLILICPCKGRAAALTISADMQFSYADSLYTEQDFESARVEFKRFIHFFPLDPRVAQAEFKYANALFNQGKNQEAARAFNALILKDREDTYTREAYFLQSRSFANAGNTAYAELVLRNFLKLTPDTGTRDRIYLALSELQVDETRQLGNDRLDEARQSLLRISDLNREAFDTAPKIAAIDRIRQMPQKEPFLAGLLAVVPGGGYLYCDRYKDALVAFGLNSGMAWAAYEAFNDGNWALGSLISFVGTGFYTGSIYGSVTAAHKLNKARQIEILNRTFHLSGGMDPGTGSWQVSFNHPF